MEGKLEEKQGRWFDLEGKVVWMALIMAGLGVGWWKKVGCELGYQVEGEEVAKPPGLVTKWFGRGGEQ